MKNIKYYSVEEAKAIIEADSKLREYFEMLQPVYEDPEERMDCGLSYCNFFEDWDSDETEIPICLYWENDIGECCISVETLEQAIVMARDIEEARGDIKA